MSCSKIKSPPYLLGLPQWPGTTQTPASGQAFAEWHNDKTQVVGANTYAEDVCGDFFPPTGLPLQTGNILFNGAGVSDMHIETDINSYDFLRLEIIYQHKYSSVTERILGAVPSSSNQFLIFAASATELRVSHGTALKYNKYTVTENEWYKIIVSRSSAGAIPTVTVIELSSNAEIPIASSPGCAVITAGKNITIGAVNNADTYASTTTCSLNISYFKAVTASKTTEIYFNSNNGGFVFGTDGIAYAINGTLAGAWNTENRYHVNNANYEGYFVLDAYDTYYVKVLDAYSNPSTYTYTLLTNSNSVIGQIIPRVAGTNYAACYTKVGSDYIPVSCTYLGRTQFPIQIHAAGLVIPPCYEATIFAGLPTGGTRLWVSVTTNWDNNDNVFCNRNVGAGTWENTDYGVAFLTARDGTTSPTKTQVEGFLGI